MYLSGYTEYHASQVELMVLLGAESIHSTEFVCSAKSKIETLASALRVEEYLGTKHQFVIDRMSNPELHNLKTTVGVLYNYFGLRSICKMYAKDYVEQVDNAATTV